MNFIIEQTNANIVVSSVWRRSSSIEKLKQILNQAGFKYSENVIDVTPIGWDVKRGEEIDTWLKQAKDIETFIILDDDSDMEPYMDRLVQTNFSTGLTIKHVNECIRRLNNI